MINMHRYWKTVLVKRFDSFPSKRIHKVVCVSVLLAKLRQSSHTHTHIHCPQEAQRSEFPPDCKKCLNLGFKPFCGQFVSSIPQPAQPKKTLLFLPGFSVFPNSPKTCISNDEETLDMIHSVWKQQPTWLAIEIRKWKEKKQVMN